MKALFRPLEFKMIRKRMQRGLMANHPGWGICKPAFMDTGSVPWASSRLWR